MTIHKAKAPLSGFAIKGILIIAMMLMVGLLYLLGPKTADAAELRTNIRVDGDYVTLGDLFTDVAAVADVVVAPAPAPGSAMTMSVNQIAPVASQYGVVWSRPQAMLRVRVERSGYMIGQSEVETLVDEAVRREGGPDKFDLVLHGQLNALYLPIDGSLDQVYLDNFSMDRRTKRFRAVLVVPQGHAGDLRANISGKLTELIAVPMLARPVAREEIISSRDIIWVDMPKDRLGQNVILAKTGIVGQAARRALRADVPLRTSDVQKPILIKKGTLVSMKIESGPLTLTALGRAAENGSRGDIIRLVNVDSHQTIEGRVVGPDKVEIMFRNPLIISGN